jgi:hypothetical protein
MAISKISKTIQEFRTAVNERGGPQISSRYEVTLSHLDQEPIVCYPLSVIVPGRNFVFYEHDLWGTVRKIPYKRGYTQCHMSFIVYQDWAERTYVEKWMNTIVRNSQKDGVNFDPNENQVQPNILTDEISTATALSQQANYGGPLASDAYFGMQYEDFIDYNAGFGTILIKFMNSGTARPTTVGTDGEDTVNKSIILKEAFPAAISQMSMASDGSGYPTFNVTFQFNSYYYI